MIISLMMGPLLLLNFATPKSLALKSSRSLFNATHFRFDLIWFIATELGYSYRQNIEYRIQTLTMYIS